MAAEQKHAFDPEDQLKLYSAVCQTTNLKHDHTQWNIYDRSGNLALLHYENEADMKTYGHLRGLVVDYVDKKTVATSLPSADMVVVDDIRREEIDGKTYYVTTSRDGIKYKYEVTQTKIRKGIEGTVIRVFKYKGKVYHAIHRYLNFANGQWGNSRTFDRVWNELGGNAITQHLFPDNVESGSHVYFFQMVHPELDVVTKIPVPQKNIFYLGCRISPNADKDARPVELQLPTIPEFTLEEANSFITYGYYPEMAKSLAQYRDKCLWPGEFVSFEQNGNIVLQVCQESYEWRLDMRGRHESVFENQFYRLIDDARAFVGSQYSNDMYVDMDKYLNYFPVLRPMSIAKIRETLQSGKGFATWDQFEEDETVYEPDLDELEADVNLRIINMWKCMLVAVPLTHQQYVVDLYENHLQTLRDLTAWIIQVYRTGTHMQKDLPARVRRMITDAIKATDRLHLPEGSQKYSANVSLLLSNWVKSEWGSSVITMLSYYRRHVKVQDPNKKSYAGAVRVDAGNDAEDKVLFKQAEENGSVAQRAYIRHLRNKDKVY